MNKIMLVITGLLVAACGNPVLVDDTPVQSLQAGGNVSLLQSSGTDFANPDSPAWRDAQEYVMDLGLAPPVHASINLRYDPDAAAVPLHLRAASDGEKLFLRLRWNDASKDTATSREQFSDAAAVQFALGGGAATSYMMGAATTPVNIWYWKASSEETQNLAAGGFGSTTRLDNNNLSASSTYREAGEWVVVFSRPLQQSGEHQVTLDQGAVSVALALWQGDTKQRDGLKHILPGWVSIQ